MKVYMCGWAGGWEGEKVTNLNSLETSAFTPGTKINSRTQLCR